MDKQKLSIEELWNSLNEEEFKLESAEKRERDFFNESNRTSFNQWFSFDSEVNILKGLKRQLWLGLMYSFIITVGYIFLMFGKYLFFVKLVLALLVFFNVLITYRMFEIMKLVNTFDIGNNLLDNARTLIVALEKWKKFQLQFALWVYPWAILGGGVLGYQIGSGLAEIPLKVILILLILAVPLSWISHRLAIWMFNKSFQKSITRIENWITDIEN